MTEPQQPAAPLEVDDPEPAPPEPNPTLEAPRRPNPDIRPEPPFEASQAFDEALPEQPESPEAPEEEPADDAPPAAEPESPEPDDDEARLPRSQPSNPSPRRSRPAEPRSAGHFVAEALRAAGVRYAFTAPRASSASSRRSATWGSASWQPGTRARRRSWPRPTDS